MADSDVWNAFFTPPVELFDGKWRVSSPYRLDSLDTDWVSSLYRLDSLDTDWRPFNGKQGGMYSRFDWEHTVYMRVRPVTSGKGVQSALEGIPQTLQEDEELLYFSAFVFDSLKI